MQDYLLTARFFHPQRELERLRSKYQMEHMDEESILPMLEVHEEYLEAALSAIEREYGSAEVYLQRALDVGPAELEELRRRYLETEATG